MPFLLLLTPKCFDFPLLMKNRGEQLSLFGAPHDDPKEPGSRGGKYYHTKTGHVRYGEKPVAEQRPLHLLTRQRELLTRQQINATPESSKKQEDKKMQVQVSPGKFPNPESLRKYEEPLKGATHDALVKLHDRLTSAMAKKESVDGLSDAEMYRLKEMAIEEMGRRGAKELTEAIKPSQPAENTSLASKPVEQRQSAWQAPDATGKRKGSVAFWEGRLSNVDIIDRGNGEFILDSRRIGGASNRDNGRVFPSLDAAKAHVETEYAHRNINGYPRQATPEERLQKLTAIDRKAKESRGEGSISNLNIAPSTQGNYLVSFPYDPDLVAAVKKIPGARFQSTAKNWMVPKEQKEALQTFAEKHGFGSLPEIDRSSK